MTIEIIAEISGCHGGSLENAKKLIVEAHAAGATGVKFQCFDPQLLTMKRTNHPRLNTKYEDVELLELYEKTHTPREWFPELIVWANETGLTWHASVFDPDDVTFLETLGCPRYKISSFEIHDADLAEAVTRTKKPLIFSINQGDDIALPPNNYPVTILHATDYAVPAYLANFATLRKLAGSAKGFLKQQWRWGLSDHTDSNLAAEIATTLGASMIEWHLRLAGVETPDDAFSWTRKEFEMKAKRIREIEEVLK